VPGDPTNGAMTGNESERKLHAYRCEACGHTEIRHRPRADAECPECGRPLISRARVVGGAIGYSLADRRQGINIEDRRLGCMAYLRGFMNLEQVAACLQIQHQAHRAGEPVPRFGEVAVAAGFLNEQQVEALLRLEALHRNDESNRSFGQLAVAMGFVTHEQLEECLAEQERLLAERLEAPFLGILMVERKFLLAEQAQEILRKQAEMGRAPQAPPEVPPEEDLFPPTPAPEGTEPRPPSLPPPPKAGETRVVGRCQACGHADIRPGWQAGLRCPACGSASYLPVETAKLYAYRCEGCGRTEIRHLPRADRDCPRCGAERMLRVQVVGGALGYSLDDRRRGISIEDRRLGCTAYVCGLLNLQQVAACLQIQHQALREGKEVPRFGDVAISAGLLTPRQVRALLRIQAIHRVAEDERTFGQLAVSEGLVTRRQVDECLAEQERLLAERLEAPFLGILLVERKYLTAEQVQDLLKKQAERSGATALERGERADRDFLAPLPPEEREQEEAPPVVASIPPPPKPGEKRVICRCDACGRTEILRRWHAGMTCPECRARAFAPVPVEEEAFSYAAADRRLGPTLEDGRLGCMAYLAGWMSERDVRRCLDVQDRAVEEGKPVPKFGEVAVREGFLTESQVRTLLRIQAIHRPIHHDRTFGAIAVKAGYVTQEQVDECLAEQERLLRERGEAPMLGLLMVERKYLSSKQVRAILIHQSRYGQGTLAELEAAGMPADTRLGRAARVLASRGGALATLGAALLLLGVLALSTGWFGTFRREVPQVVVGCKNCEAVFRVRTVGDARCPKCGREKSIAPLVRCARCGHVYLYGALGSGTKCPKCGARGYAPLQSPSEAGDSWKRPPLPDEDEEAGE